MKRLSMKSFSVIGKEGSTNDGPDFIAHLWEDANTHFSEIAHLAKLDEDGVPIACWGVMTDFSRRFLPWENFRYGLYLAGVECIDEAEAPGGWTKWTLPSFDFLCAENNEPDSFSKALAQLLTDGYALAGAVQEMTYPKTGMSMLCFPIKRSEDS